ncbi:MAG: hypothetical protein DLM52_12250 [Chthoniobacterales bacterium]|nr:MAG: hypothetical protein DLM52_12250 [Chthoniobacterales bacterium]
MTLKRQRKNRLTQLAPRFTAIVTAAIGTAVLVGWTFQLEWLKRFGEPALIAMNPVTACCFIAASSGLLLLWNPQADRQQRRVGQLAAVTSAAVGALKLLSVRFGWSIGPEHWIFPARIMSSPGSTEGLVPRTALNLLLLGAALLVLDVRTRRGRRPAELLSAISAGIAILGLVGYSCGVIDYYTKPSYIPSSLPADMAFLLMATGTLLSRADRGIMCIVVSDSAGGVLARRLIPLAILLPLFLGTLRLIGESAGLWGARFGAAHAETAFMILFFGAIWLTAKLLYRAEEERKAAEVARDINAEELRMLNAELERRVADRTAKLNSLNDELRRASKAKDDFLAVLSHELRTPLTPALAAATDLAADEELAPELREQLARIRRNVQLEARLIDDLLDLTRITRGKIELHLETADTHRLLLDALEIVDEDIRQKKLEVSVGLAAEHHHTVADPVRMQQVFWNLLNNAVKFTASGGRIQISSVNENGTIVIEISDSGVGIERENQRRIFNAFEQGERATTRQFGGLGLGLTISKGLVDLHRGTIAVRSAGNGMGATFRLTLAVTQAPQSTAQPRAIPKLAKTGLRLLLVDDHSDTLGVLSRILGKRGFDVRTATTIAEARELLQCHVFDALISDIGLPDGNGYKLMRVARQRQPLRGIAISGFGMEKDLRLSREAGFEHHLTKPIDPRELETLLACGQPGT